MTANLIGQATLAGQKAKLKLRSESGRTVPTVNNGTIVTVRNGSATLVSGIFSGSSSTDLTPTVSPTDFAEDNITDCLSDCFANRFANNIVDKNSDSNADRFTFAERWRIARYFERRDAQRRVAARFG